MPLPRHSQYVRTHGMIRHYAASFDRWARSFSKLGIQLETPSGDGYIRSFTIGQKQVVFCADALPINNAGSQWIAKDKLGAYQILSQAGVTVPTGAAFFRKYYQMDTTGVDDTLLVDHLPAWLAEHYPFHLDDPRAIVKPGRSSKGIGVECCKDTATIMAHTQLVLEKLGHYVLVQEFIDGDEYRICMLDGVVLLAYAKRAPALVGNGISTIADLVGLFNDMHRKFEGAPDILNATYLPRLLDEKGGERLVVPTSVIPAGEVLLIDGGLSNLSQGSWPDILENPPAPALAIARAATDALGLRYSGVDIRLHPDGSHAVVLEVNGNPGFDFLETYQPAESERVTNYVVNVIVSSAG